MTVFRLNPLPDFLADHTLAGEAESTRLREHAARWVQFVAGLWVWHERASFALRYVGHDGAIDCFFVAVARRGIDQETLTRCLEASLLSHRLIRATDNYLIDAARFHDCSRLQAPYFLDRSQLVSTQLWSFPQHLRRDKRFREAIGNPAMLPEEPPVVFPWQGPSGSFITPMELLVAQPVKSVLTIYLSPVEMPSNEMRLLSILASAAQTAGSQVESGIGQSGGGSRVDVASTIAGEIYSSHLRRLAPNSFFTLAQVAAEGGRADVARSLVASLAACVMDPQMEGGGSGFPVGLSPCLDIDDQGGSEENQLLYERIDLREHAPEDMDVRLQLLTDARGAATLFRFPVSVRGGVPGIEVRQFPPDFHEGPIRDAPPAGVRSIILGRNSSGGIASLPVDDLTRHALIVGFTGSGKTVTSLRLLHQILVDHSIPWLVLESAKQEYRGLLTVDAIRSSGRAVRVYTLGNDSCVPFRLNPFELLQGMRVEAHVARLQVCFEAAVPPVGPSSSVIFEALVKVYEKHGWPLDACHEVGRTEQRSFPTLRTFVDVIGEVIKERGYRGEVLANVEAALIGRFKPLLMGSKGLMFDVQASDPPPDVLFNEPVVLEMNDLNLDDKAMTVMFVLTLLREYREVKKYGRRGLQHVTMVEEAHNILEEVGHGGGSESQANTRGKAVSTFCTMLAEIRSLGEGIIIADQSPQKLARDAIRNTNLQIAHQLRDGNDRNTVATAMIMDEDQVNFLGKLQVGHAAVFWTGREKAGFIKVDSYYDGDNAPGRGFSRDLGDTELRDYMAAFHHSLDLKPWLEWYRLISPATRRAQGVSLAAFWDRALELAGGLAPSVPAEMAEDRAWPAFVAAWERITLLASVSQSGRRLTSTHRQLFKEAFSRSGRHGTSLSIGNQAPRKASI